MEMLKFVTLMVIISNLLTSAVILCQDHATQCPLWHSRKKGRCECDQSIQGIIRCSKDCLYIEYGHCLTWNNITRSLEVGLCILNPRLSNACEIHGVYMIDTNISGLELNRMVCGHYNRQGVQCRECLDGYGPAMISDGVTCADCSKHKHLWLLSLLFQLMMVTVMYLVIILFQIKGTASPLNVIIMYSQSCVNVLTIRSILRVKLACFIGQRITTIFLTVIGVMNLDFFRFLIPPLCISASIKFINSLLFDYILAIYPLILTVFMYLIIELHDREYQIITCLSYPVRKIYKFFSHKNWNPKITVLDTAATFLLLSYSKFLYTSINLLFAVQSYNENGTSSSQGSAVLLYDPTVTFFHSEHIPYVVIALSVILVFIVLPPMLLLLYPTKIFRKFLNCCGFQRWDLLQLIMDIFQGWYKDGEEETRDYRSLSALYFLLRIIFSCLFVVIVSQDSNYSGLTGDLLAWYVFGVFHVTLGAIFLMVRPYRKEWMNSADGLFFTTFGVFLLLKALGDHASFMIGLTLGLSVAAITVLCIGYRCLKKLCSCTCMHTL